MSPGLEVFLYSEAYLCCKKMKVVSAIINSHWSSTLISRFSCKFISSLRRPRHFHSDGSKFSNGSTTIVCTGRDMNALNTSTLFCQPVRYWEFSLYKRPFWTTRSCFHTKPEIDCWKCSATSENFGLFCANCDAIRDPAQVEEYDYFKLLGLPKEFGLDVKEMEKIFWKLQMNLHPDKFAQSSDKEKRYSSLLSSRINHAYNVLKCPVQRAQYLLEMKGIDALSEGGETNTDPILLMEAMEAREKLEETENLEDLGLMKNNFLSTIKGVDRDLRVAFDSDQFDEAAKLAIRLRYLTKVVDEIDEKLLRLDT